MRLDVAMIDQELADWRCVRFQVLEEPVYLFNVGRAVINQRSFVLDEFGSGFDLPEVVQSSAWVLTTTTEH